MRGKQQPPSFSNTIQHAARCYFYLMAFAMVAPTSGLRAVEVYCGRITPNCCVLNYSREYQECQSIIKDE